MRSEGILVVNHAVEASGGTDGLFLCQFLIWHNVLSIQLLPGAYDIDVIKGLANPCFMVTGEVVSRLTPQGMKLLSVSSADAPYILDG